MSSDYVHGHFCLLSSRDAETHAVGKYRKEFVVRQLPEFIETIF